ncbi:unnamed protein product, partial [Closterium sp. NIES-54]
HPSFLPAHLRLLTPFPPSKLQQFQQQQQQQKYLQQQQQPPPPPLWGASSQAAAAAAGAAAWQQQQLNFGTAAMAAHASPAPSPWGPFPFVPPP